MFNQAACKALNSLGTNGFSVSATKAQIKEMRWPTACFAPEGEHYGVNCGIYLKTDLDEAIDGQTATSGVWRGPIGQTLRKD